jgi:hypothetical protein
MTLATAAGAAGTALRLGPLLIAARRALSPA